MFEGANNSSVCLEMLTMSITNPSDLTLSIILYQLARLSLLLGLIWLINRVGKTIVFSYRVRTRYDDIPHHPRHRLWGHLLDIAPRLSPTINQHPDYVFEELWEDLGRPPAFIVDLAVQDSESLIRISPYRGADRHH